MVASAPSGSVTGSWIEATCGSWAEVEVPELSVFCTIDGGICKASVAPGSPDTLPSAPKYRPSMVVSPCPRLAMRPRFTNVGRASTPAVRPTAKSPSLRTTSLPSPEPK